MATYQPDHRYVDLLAAVVARARQDAQRGDPHARAWLADLRATVATSANRRYRW